MTPKKKSDSFNNNETSLHPRGASDTPRTDDSAESVTALDYTDKGRVVWCNDMAELEREFAVALKERDDLNKKLSQARDDMRDMEREIDRLVRMN